MSALIGLDIGTTACKASLFREDGTLVAKATREYSIQIPHKGWAEQNAEIVWTLAEEALAQVLKDSGTRDVVAIGISAQGEAVMPVNAQGQTLRPAILGMDTRTDAQNVWLRERFGAEHLFDLTGVPVHTINTLPKLLWLREHEPEIWSRADKFLLYEDFVIHKMTGQAMVSRCLASRTQMYDLKADCWNTDLLDAAGLAPSRLSLVQQSGKAVGEMRPDLASALGFSRPPLVVSGGHDQACGALGVGLTKPGLAMVSTGTAEVMEVSLDQPTVNKSLYESNISVYAHVVPGLYLAMTLNHSGGLLLRWFRDTFGQEELRQAQIGGLDAYDLILKNAPDHPTRLMVLPHFSGSGTPTFDIASKGAILGLTFASTRPEIAKALLEGLTFELRLNLDLLIKGGIFISELRAIGGGARSAIWVQLKADITGLPVAVPIVTEAAGWGAALLAGVGAGVFENLDEAVNVTFEQRYLPGPYSPNYQERYQVYQSIYPTLAALNHRL
ncbi:MAG: xylulokinase [Chloroflexota bacterium]|nr:MAG: xylulokinase [Chloroflexota bacterium]